MKTGLVALAFAWPVLETWGACGERFSRIFESPRK
jgi:hypothetical protein